jgi:hypothetical protein
MFSGKEKKLFFSENQIIIHNQNRKALFPLFCSGLFGLSMETAHAFQKIG